MSTPRYLGGQAVVEGVMMRGERSWAVAVRTPEGDIELAVHDAPRWADRWSKLPIVRGVAALAESLALGFRALTWSADRQLPEEERISSRAMGWTIGGALLFFTALFIVLPTFINAGVSNLLGVGGITYHLAEGAIRLSIFLGYLALISLLPDIKRVSSTTAPNTKPSPRTSKAPSSRPSRPSATPPSTCGAGRTSC